jgi:hypothetical protein
MAQLLEQAAEKRVVESETGVILEHAQRLAGTVGAGVNDPCGVDRLLRVFEQERRVHDQGRQLLGGALPQRLVTEAAAFEVAAHVRRMLQKREQHLVGGEAALLGDAGNLRTSLVEDVAHVPRYAQVSLLILLRECSAVRGMGFTPRVTIPTRLTQERRAVPFRLGEQPTQKVHGRHFRATLLIGEAGRPLQGDRKRGRGFEPHEDSLLIVR